MVQNFLSILPQSTLNRVALSSNEFMPIRLVNVRRLPSLSIKYTIFQTQQLWAIHLKRRLSRIAGLPECGALSNDRLHTAVHVQGTLNLHPGQQIDQYLALRNDHGSEAITSFALNLLPDILRSAYRDSNSGFLNYFTADLLSQDSIDPESKIYLVQLLLELESRQQQQCIADSSILRLARYCISKHNDLYSVPSHILALFANTALRDNTAVTKRHSFLNGSPLLTALDESRFADDKPNAGDGTNSEIDVHLPNTWFLFRYLVLLVKKNELKAALGLLQQLLAAGRLAPNSVHQEDETIPQTIIGTLIRSCITWNWASRAVRLFHLAIDDTPGMPITESRSQLVNNTLLQWLDRIEGMFDRKDLVKCADLLCEGISRENSMHFGTSVIRRFYEVAYKLETVELAGRVYKALALAGDKNLPEHLPRGYYFLPWLLSWYTTQLHDVHAGRLLANHICDKEYPINFITLPLILQALSKPGLYTQAKELWRRYSESSSHSRSEERGRMLLLGSATAMRAIVSISVRMAHKANLLVQRESDTGYGSIRDEMDSITETADEYTAFARQVVARFLEVKTPLQKASRYDLNALSRSYFELGDVDEAIAMIKILLRRGETPTERELGVVLAGLACLNPRRAAGMLQVMIEKGITPQASDFGAIIHEAALRGDSELVGALVTKARDVGHDQLSMQGLHSLLRFSIRFRRADGRDRHRAEEEAQTLRRALRMIKSLPGVDHVPTPWMGARCIRASLRVNQAAMAFEFWKLLVREREDWAHGAQVRLRRQIGSQVRHDIRRGWVAIDRGRRMLDELGEGYNSRIRK